MFKLKAGNKHPLKECLGENAGPSKPKRRRFDNIVLLQEEGENSDDLINNGSEERREGPRTVLRAGRKRKKPSEERSNGTISNGTNRNSSLNTPPASAVPEKDENDIINELTNQFKKARLRPVFFTISSFIEQTVDEVGFTVGDGDEPDTEVTVRLTLKPVVEAKKEAERVDMEKLKNELNTGSGISSKTLEYCDSDDENVANIECDLKRKKNVPEFPLQVYDNTESVIP